MNYTLFCFLTIIRKKVIKLKIQHFPDILGKE